ncbi:MAG: hypothetical protein IKY23_08920 [Lachnospiraceae bacterium]|nr:hypothetical protein [Lachnospiraceae bacterium]
MGVQVWTGFQQMQSYYKSYDIPRVTPEEVKTGEQEALQSAQQSAEADIAASALAVSEPEEILAEPDLRSKNADLENISLTFHKEDTYDYIGSRSGLATLDMQQAISDMKKDSVLQEYQYFVGSSQSFMSSADGTVILK